MVKPDGVKKGLIGEVIKRFEQRDLKIVALEMFQPTHAELDNHYPKDAVWIKRLGGKTLATYEKYNLDPLEDFGTKDAEKLGTEIRKWLIDFMLSAPLVKMIVEGTHADHHRVESAKFLNREIGTAKSRHVITELFDGGSDVVAYDSDPNELVSTHVAAELLKKGIKVRVLKGGVPEWLAANFPTETKEAPRSVPPEPGSLKG